ncbi:hypothetical protein EYF80_048327 [Liparis tanakae]|uniref:Uncharacterized protein n=1 Tax=Liparis tanakae TaxID=230148 RepID=A0A4Z2FK22_9TELE|nr:hypothetical protein EYF80_048327 [Liparis tanakae]
MVARKGDPIGSMSEVVTNEMISGHDGVRQSENQRDVAVQNLWCCCGPISSLKGALPFGHFSMGISAL